MTEKQKKALYELNRHLAYHNNSLARQELLENIDAMIRAQNGSRAFKLISDWYKNGEEYLLEHAKDY